MRRCPGLFADSGPEDDAYFSWEGVEDSKTSGHLLHLLNELGAFVGGHSHGWGAQPGRNFRAMPGRVYMALLAKRISEKCILPVVTDDEVHDRILYSSAIFSELDHGQDFPQSLVVGASERRIQSRLGRHRDGFAFCQLTFRAIGIEDFETVTPAKIMRIRERCNPERKAFVAEIEKAVSDLQDSPVESKGALREMLKDRAREFNRARELYDQSIRAMGVQTAVSLLRTSVSIPIADALAKYLTLGQATTVGIAAAGGLVSIMAVLHKTAFERNKEREAKPVAFYLSQVARASK